MNLNDVRNLNQRRMIAEASLEEKNIERLVEAGLKNRLDFSMIDEAEQIAFKIRTEILTFLQEHGNIQTLKWLDTDYDIKNGTIVVTQKMGNDLIADAEEINKINQEIGTIKKDLGDLGDQLIDVDNKIDAIKTGLVETTNYSEADVMYATISDAEDVTVNQQSINLQTGATTATSEFWSDFGSFPKTFTLYKNYNGIFETVGTIYSGSTYEIKSIYITNNSEIYVNIPQFVKISGTTATQTNTQTKKMTKTPTIKMYKYLKNSEN